MWWARHWLCDNARHLQPLHDSIASAGNGVDDKPILRGRREKRINVYIVLRTASGM